MIWINLYKVDQSILGFGAACDGLLLKFGPKVIDQQFLLHRLAEAAIDIYGSVAVLSRATKSIAGNAATSTHEQALAEFICFRVGLNFHVIIWVPFILLNEMSDYLLSALFSFFINQWDEICIRRV